MLHIHRGEQARTHTIAAATITTQSRALCLLCSHSSTEPNGTARENFQMCPLARSLTRSLALARPITNHTRSKPNIIVSPFHKWLCTAKLYLCIKRTSSIRVRFMPHSPFCSRSHITNCVNTHYIRDFGERVCARARESCFSTRNWCWRWRWWWCCFSSQRYLWFAIFEQITICQGAMIYTSTIQDMHILPGFSPLFMVVVFDVTSFWLWIDESIVCFAVFMINKHTHTHTRQIHRREEKVKSIWKNFSAQNISVNVISLWPDRPSDFQKHFQFRQMD